MRTRVQRWGNSLALRLPSAFARAARIGPNTPVELSLSDGKLIIAPIIETEPTLDELLAGITDENWHGEWETGPAVGNETW